MTLCRTLEHDWFPAPLPPNVELGERSWCYSAFAFLHFRSRCPRAVRIGHDTGIYHGTFFDLGPEAEVDIGHYCTLVGAILCTNRRLLIGDYTFIAHEVLLADTAAAKPFDTADASEVQPASAEPSIVVAENCWIGARAVLLAGARLGEGCIVGAAALVDFEVPAGAIVAGNPARIVGRAGAP